MKYLTTLHMVQFSFWDMQTFDFDKNGKELRDLLIMTRNMGLAMMDKDNLEPSDPQPFCIAILPAIVDVFSVEAIDRFGASLKASLIGKEPLDPTEDEQHLDEGTDIDELIDQPYSGSTV